MTNQTQPVWRTRTEPFGTLHELLRDYDGDRDEIYSGPIPTIEMNVFKAFENLGSAILCHQANCQCTMGAGIAAKIAQLYPAAQLVDAETQPRDDKLGGYSLAVVGADDWGVRIIANMYSQNHPGGEPYRHPRATSYDAVYDAWRSLLDWRADNDIDLPIVLPELYGSDIAGGDWDIVSSIIGRLCDEYDTSVLACRLPPTAE